MQFKTNIKCSACVEKVSPALNRTLGVNNWAVDLIHPKRILKVSDEENPQEIQSALQESGYHAELISENAES